MKTHRCFKQVDKELAKHNTRLARNILDANQLFVGTEVVDESIRGPRRAKPKPKVMIASHCPFCGDKLT
jgi:hypothetical protein